MSAVDRDLLPAIQLEVPSGRWRDRLTLANTVPLALFAAAILAALLAPVLAPHNPITPAGVPLQPPSVEHWAGTDAVGRDIFSRMLYGARLSVTAAAVVITSGLVIGAIIGLVAGAVGGWGDGLLMRITDLFLALPAPVLAIAIAGALGASFWHTVLALVIVWWPLYARLGRGEVRALRARPHFEAARMARIGRIPLWGRHLLPGALPPLLIAASLDVGFLFLMLAGLSFLGLGAPEPVPELGSMTAQGMTFLTSDWWVPVMPAIAVAIFALLANYAGDALRDVLAGGH